MRTHYFACVILIPIVPCENRFIHLEIVQIISQYVFVSQMRNMDQPNYNFAYQAGGIVKFLWKNTIGQDCSSNSNNDNSGNGNCYGKNNSWQTQQTKTNSGSSQQQKKSDNESQK